MIKLILSQLSAMQLVTSPSRLTKSKCKRNDQWSFHQRLRLQNCFFTSILLTKTLYAFPFCPVLVTCPTHLILLDLIILIILDE